jgi:hypothetical protein
MYVDYCWLRNRWRKLGPPDPKNNPRSLILRLTLTSSTQINYNRQTNRWWKLSPCCTKNHPLHGLPLAQKPLTKTRTLGPKKSSKQPSCTADADIFCGNKLILTYKSLMKNEPLCPKNHPRKPVLRLTLKSSLYMDYCWLRNRWRKLGPPDPKNNPRRPVLRLTLTSSAQINYNWQTNPWWKLSPCCTKNQPPKPILRLTLKSSLYMDYCCSETVDENQYPRTQKNMQEAQFYGWRWHLLWK